MAAKKSDVENVGVENVGIVVKYDLLTSIVPASLKILKKNSAYQHL